VTTEERLDRIEHITATLSEERRKDREEYKMLWRGTQRQIDDLAVETRRLGDRIDQLGDRLGERIDQLGERIDQFATESRAADKQLGEGIESLVSAIGLFLNKGAS
jgi:uncharacterized coiled-coil DUF342 family protein